jgi:hypothetical protein
LKAPETCKAEVNKEINQKHVHYVAYYTTTFPAIGTSPLRKWQTFKILTEFKVSVIISIVFCNLTVGCVSNFLLALKLGPCIFIVKMD